MRLDTGHDLEARVWPGDAGQGEPFVREPEGEDVAGREVTASTLSRTDSSSRPSAAWVAARASQRT